MIKKYIVDGKLELFTFQKDDEPIKIENGVILNQFPDGVCYVHSWEPQSNGKTLVSFSLENNLYAKVYDWELKNYQEITEIKKPKGLGYVYRDGCWKKPWQ